MYVCHANDNHTTNVTNCNNNMLNSNDNNRGWKIPLEITLTHNNRSFGNNGGYYRLLSVVSK